MAGAASWAGPAVVVVVVAVIEAAVVAVTNGVDGETCSDFMQGDSELWCTFAQIPDCVDRTINCTDPPQTNKATIQFLEQPDLKSQKEYKTRWFNQQMHSFFRINKCC